jgi:hypothetical protein
LKSSLPHILALCLLPGLALAQGVPTNDSGLTARDIVETGDREADLAVQADKLAVRELIAEIDPNPGGAQMFGDAAENIEQLIIRVAQETSGFAGVGRAGLSPVQWRVAASAHLAGKPFHHWGTVSRRRLWSHPDHAGHSQRSGH